MGNKRNGWALGFGIYGGAYQLFAGLILMLFCSKIGGIPYGIALMLAGVAGGVIAYFAHNHKWAKITLLFLGVANILLVFALGFLIEKVGGFKQGADSIVLAFRVICFNPAIALFLSGIWSFEPSEDKKKKFLISSIIAKVVLILGVALCAAVSALSIWHMTSNASFTEWFYGLFGDESLTGSALIEAQILLRSEFVQWVRAVGPVLEGIGVLLVALIPAYAWYLYREGILFEEKSFLKTLIVSLAGAPFLLVGVIVLVVDFVSTGSIASLIFAIVTLLAVGGAWALCQFLPARKK